MISKNQFKELFDVFEDIDIDLILGEAALTKEDLDRLKEKTFKKVDDEIKDDDKEIEDAKKEDLMTLLERLIKKGQVRL